MTPHATLPSTIAPLPAVTDDSKATATILLSEPLSPIVELDELGELKILHFGTSRPPTPEPPPPSLQPPPFRYPDTLNALISISVTEGKGFGVFACVDIPAGTVLLYEAPLITLIDTGTRHDPLDVAVEALTPVQKASFLSLHVYTPNKNDSLNRSIVYSNGYSIMKGLATGVFETASRINHSCVPNSHYEWIESKFGEDEGKERKVIGRMMFWNRFKLLAGEEVTVDYGHRKGQLKRIYGFDCTCGGCTESGSEAMSSRSESERGEVGEIPSINEVIEEGLAKQVVEMGLGLKDKNAGEE